jgi:hypothetical protein
MEVRLNEQNSQIFRRSTENLTVIRRKFLKRFDSVLHAENKKTVAQNFLGPKTFQTSPNMFNLRQSGVDWGEFHTLFLKYCEK